MVEHCPATCDMCDRQQNEMDEMDDFDDKEEGTRFGLITHESLSVLTFI